MELSARSGSLEIMKDLLYFGADVEEAGQGGRPPLVSAAAHQHLDVMKLLLDNGADINSRDVKGNTALHEAVRLKEPVDFVYLLLRRGADSKLSNTDEKNPMEVSCTHTHTHTRARAHTHAHTSRFTLAILTSRVTLPSNTIV